MPKQTEFVLFDYFRKGRNGTEHWEETEILVGGWQTV